HPGAAVEGDLVPLRRGQPADRVPRGGVVEVDAARTVRERRARRDVEPDQIALHQVRRRPGQVQLDAVVAVARDDVARGGRRPADRVRVRAGEELDAVVRVRNGRYAGQVDPDEVPGDDVGRCVVAAQHAVAPVAGDDVPR